MTKFGHKHIVIHNYVTTFFHVILICLLFSGVLQEDSDKLRKELHNGKKFAKSMYKCSFLIL